MYVYMYIGEYIIHTVLSSYWIPDTSTSRHESTHFLNTAEDAEILDTGTIGIVAALFFVASGAQNHSGGSVSLRIDGLTMINTPQTLILACPNHSCMMLHVQFTGTAPPSHRSI